MKLIGELKKQVESTNTKEEAKDVIENAGMELTDDELDQVTAGDSTPLTKDAITQLKEEEEERKRLEEQMNNNDNNIMAPLLFGVPN